MDISLEALDLTLKYLNNDKMSSLELLGEMVELEGRQFINLTESNDIEVLNEKLSFSQLKEKIVKFIETIIEKIKSFITWVKNKVVGFFKKIFAKIKERKSLKELLRNYKNKKSSTNESYDFLNEASDDLDSFLAEKTHVIKDFTPNDMSKKIDEFLALRTKLFNENWFSYVKGGEFNISYPYPSNVTDGKYDMMSFKQFIDADIQEQVKKLEDKLNKLADTSCYDKYINALTKKKDELRAKLKEDKDQLSDDEYDKIWDEWDATKSNISRAESCLVCQKDLYSRLKSMVGYILTDISKAESFLSK